MTVTLQTSMGRIKGNDHGDYNEFLGVRFARAGRFEYAVPVDSWDGEYDAAAPGPACPQTRGFYPHFEHPTRRFYHHEFREGQTFEYSEDCLNLNIYAPKEAKDCPVIIYFYGGGFDSGMNSESPFNGAAYAKKGVIMVVPNYRVGIMGYLTHEEIFRQYGRDGNFGLDDQLTAVKWVRAHIADFGGDPENITVSGQSAGAISTQYLCLCEKAAGLFKHAFMMSGGGMFPKFALPREAENTRPYWQEFIDSPGIGSFEALKTMDFRDIYAKLEPHIASHKGNVYNTMPVIDGYLLTDHVDKLIKKPAPVDYMLGYTNNDMYAIIMEHIGHVYANANGAFVYYFDIDAPGDDRNAAFHSCDVRYVFGTLDGSHRPYTKHDHEISDMMTDYICEFAKKGDPNKEGLPEWKKGGSRVLCISPKAVKMGRPGYAKLVRNTLIKGDPVARDEYSKETAAV